MLGENLSNCELTSIHSIHVSDDALSAVEELSQGDMRKCLNILQVILIFSCAV
jgi:DNA polymerase III delta prime subunit